MLKLLGGVAKGLKIATPPGDSIRPMGVMLKRRFFDRYQDFSGRHFVDLCAGSGALGLEAWSRGAAQVTLLEKSSQVSTITFRNKQTLEEKFPQEMKTRPLTLLTGDALNWAKKAPPLERAFMMMAPPYPDHALYEKLLTALTAWRAHQISLAIESDTHKGPAANSIRQWAGGEETKIIGQGSRFVLIYEDFPLLAPTR